MVSGPQAELNVGLGMGQMVHGFSFLSLNFGASKVLVSSHHGAADGLDELLLNVGLCVIGRDDDHVTVHDDLLQESV